MSAEEVQLSLVSLGISCKQMLILPMRFPLRLMNSNVLYFHVPLSKC